MYTGLGFIDLPMTPRNCVCAIHSRLNSSQVTFMLICFVELLQFKKKLPPIPGRKVDYVETNIVRW